MVRILPAVRARHTSHDSPELCKAGEEPQGRMSYRSPGRQKLRPFETLVLPRLIESFHSRLIAPPTSLYTASHDQPRCEKVSQPDDVGIVGL